MEGIAHFLLTCGLILGCTSLPFPVPYASPYIYQWRPPRGQSSFQPNPAVLPPRYTSPSFVGPLTPHQMTDRALTLLEARWTGPTGRIIKGRNANPGEVPYQLNIAKDDKIKKKHTDANCGGVLVDVYDIQFALTAAHCVHYGYPDRWATYPVSWIRVIAGDYNIKVTEAQQQIRAPESMIMHDQYNMDLEAPKNDIAIIFYKRPFTITSFVSPLRLPEHNWNVPGSGIVSGWGSITKDAPTYPDTLMLTWLYTVYPKECKRYGTTYKQFCMLGDLNGASTCFGDSGGPMAAKNKTLGTDWYGLDSWYLAGLTSYGVNGKCGDYYYPTVYVRVSTYIDWIRIQVNKYIDDKRWPTKIPAEGAGRRSDWDGK
ncbi:Trypsin-1 [Orchesella cincta]|uniref:Trypsin-1 n=1 Tax=Orchesella cincta TaxID=48709 RepID=A0A1D2MN32_ORCCI|nr:Trypsin-1 [Orchesella cincta]